MIDRKEGFPATMIEAQSPDAEVRFRIVDNSLQIRSKRAASRYLGDDQPAMIGPEGFVDTGDIVELRGDRYYFVGRRGGVINVGGQKIFPEEVENVINRHPAVRMSLVHGRRNPMMGALVVADVVLDGLFGFNRQGDREGNPQQMPGSPPSIQGAGQSQLCSEPEPIGSRKIGALKRFPVHSKSLLLLSSLTVRDPRSLSSGRASRGPVGRAPHHEGVRPTAKISNSSCPHLLRASTSSRPFHIKRRGWPGRARP